jgi:hypothetical protein
MLGVPEEVVVIPEDLDLVEEEDFLKQLFQFLPEIHLQSLLVEVEIVEDLMQVRDLAHMVAVDLQVLWDMVEMVVDLQEFFMILPPYLSVLHPYQDQS